MAGKTNAWETKLLQLLFNNANAASIGDATGLRGSTTAGSLYLSLHTAEPGETGSQNTSEIAYTNYARVGVLRASGAGGWTVSGNTANLASNTDFAQAGASGAATVSYFGVGTDSSGAGTLLYFGPVNPTIPVSEGVTPRLTTATQISEE